MAGKRITSLNTLTGANTATIDVLPIVDVSAGEAKQITTQELSNALVTINGGLQGGFGVYTNTTLGLANTANGGYFFVPSANTGESLSMYQDVGGNAVYITGIPEFNTTENPYGGLSRQDYSSISDIFIYDTTKDSDGGEWRKKCQHTSWYNEQLNTATRGSRREFPEKALIVLRNINTASLIIYDLDNGTPEMWMIFQATGTSLANNPCFLYANQSSRLLSKVFALNGMITVGTYNSGGVGMNLIDFIKDNARLIRTTTWETPIGDVGISYRNSMSGYISQTKTGLVDTAVNSIAMDVRPGTPPNKKRYDLPNPTIAVGTDSGVSIIHWDERVADITWSTYTIVRSINFRPTDKALCIAIDSGAAGRFRHVYHQLPMTDITNSNGYLKGSADEFYPFVFSSAYTGLAWPFNSSVLNYSNNFTGIYDCGYLQLTSILPEPSKPENGSRAVITNTYNTGYMPGNTVLALAESTYDTTSLVENELVTNGDFATNDLTNWTILGTGTYTANASSGAVNLQGTGSSGTTDRAWIEQALILENGKSYVLTYETTAATSGLVTASIGTVSAGTQMLTSLATSSVETKSTTFTATAGNAYLSFRTTGATDITIDNISVKLAVPDRSIWTHPVYVKGNVTRTAVATGAELAGFTGFTANDYIEGSGANIADIGTSDFSIMLWLKTSVNSDYILTKWGGGSTSGYYFYIFSSGTTKFVTTESGNNTAVDSLSVLSDGQWHFMVITRNSSGLRCYVDGKLEATNTGALRNAASSEFLRIGNRGHDSALPFDGELAQIRFSTTVPTPEQIRTMYERERLLFAANTKCLTPAITNTTMSYDEEYDILYATTTGGAYTVKGIQILDKVIDNNLVYSGITATSNITSKWTSTGANTYIPSIYPFRSEINKSRTKKPYERNKVKVKTYTTSATPKVIYHIPFDEGEEATLVTRTIGVNRDDGTQIGSYEHKYTARRVNGSADVALIGSTNTVIQEVTSSMDVIVSNTNNYITISYTGLASNTIEWTSYTEGTFNDF